VFQATALFLVLMFPVPFLGHISIFKFDPFLCHSILIPLRVLLRYRAHSAHGFRKNFEEILCL
ncbi:MAG: hypothetical protein RPT00_09935, partial [Gammaproteobacteria bacterium]